MDEETDVPDMIPLWGPAVAEVVVEEAVGERQFARLLLTTRGLGCGLNAADGSVDDARPRESSLVEDPTNINNNVFTKPYPIYHHYIVYELLAM